MSKVPAKAGIFVHDIQTDLVLTEQYVSRCLAGDLVQLTDATVSTLVALDDDIGFHYACLLFWMIVQTVFE